MAPERGPDLKRHQLCAFVLVAVLLVLPFTGLYGGAGGLEHGLFLVVVVLAVIAMGLLVTPLAQLLLAGRQTQANLTARGLSLLYVAVTLAGILLLDLTGTWLVGEG